MTKTSLKSYFNTGDIPTEAQFSELIDGIPGRTGFLVAASNAPAWVKSIADYVCDGVNDQVEINAALLALEIPTAYDGGTVELSKGDFYLTTSLTFNKPWKAVWFKGQGANTTLLHFTLSAPGICIEIANGFVNRGSKFSDFQIIGDSVNAQYGIYNHPNCFYNHYCNIAIYGITDISFYCDTGFSQSYIERIRVHNPTNYGIKGDFTACTIKDCIAAGGMTATGFCFSGAGNSTMECTADHVNIGFHYLPPVTSWSSVGCYAEACNQGILIGPGWLCNSITILGGLIASRAGATGLASIEIQDSDTVTLVGVGVDSQIDLTSFYIHSDVTNCKLINCYPGYVAGGRPTIPYTIEAGAEIDIEDHRYHPTDNHGHPTVADGGTIAHGLVLTPSEVWVQPTIAGELISVTAKNATTFTISIKKHDGTAGTTQPVYWRAWV